MFFLLLIISRMRWLVHVFILKRNEIKSLGERRALHNFLIIQQISFTSELLAFVIYPFILDILRYLGCLRTGTNNRERFIWFGKKSWFINFFHSKLWMTLTSSLIRTLDTLLLSKICNFVYFRDRSSFIWNVLEIYTEFC